MKKETYIGIELAKKLKEGGCEIESDKFWWQSELGDSELISISDPKFSKLVYLKAVLFPAYHYHDIIVTYATGFLGKNYNVEMVGRGRILSSITETILDLLQQGNQNEKELWEDGTEQCIDSNLYGMLNQSQTKLIESIVEEIEKKKFKTVTHNKARAYNGALEDITNLLKENI